MPDVYADQNTATPRWDDKEHESHAHPKPTNSRLSAFCYQPEGINFDTQDSGEKIVLLLRQHPITLLPRILLLALLILAPNILTVFPLLDFLPLRFQFIAILFWYLIVAAFVIESALSWFFNVYMVTDERVIDVDFENLIYREVSEANIDKIQDLDYKAGGVPSAIFNYGDVYIQTAGTVPNFEFRSVPNPSEIARIIQELRVGEEQEALEGRVR